jgi:hypothetical protein
MVDRTTVCDCVKDTTFPASVESILQSAREHHCSMEALVRLTHIPAKRYDSASDVVDQATSSTR